MQSFFYENKINVVYFIESFFIPHHHQYIYKTIPTDYYNVSKSLTVLFQQKTAKKQKFKNFSKMQALELCDDPGAVEAGAKVVQDDEGKVREDTDVPSPILDANIEAFGRLSLGGEQIGNTCPTCRKILFSPFAIKLFLVDKVTCPVCLEDVGPIMGLACGHSLCIACFEIQFPLPTNFLNLSTVAAIASTTPQRTNAAMTREEVEENPELVLRRTYPFLFFGNEEHFVSYENFDRIFKNSGKRMQAPGQRNLTATRCRLSKLIDATMRWKHDPLNNIMSANSIKDITFYCDIPDDFEFHACFNVWEIAEIREFSANLLRYIYRDLPRYSSEITVKYMITCFYPCMTKR